MNCNSKWQPFATPSDANTHYCYPDEASPTIPPSPDTAASPSPSPHPAGDSALPAASSLLGPVASLDLGWYLETVRAATPWLVLLTMLVYLCWEVWNVYTDYYGCEQICKFRKEDDPFFKNPGEHLMSSLQGTKQILMDSLTKKENSSSDKENELDGDELTKSPKSPQEAEITSVSVTRKLDFTDLPTTLRLRRHKRWSASEKEITRTAIDGTFEKGFVPRTVAMLNSGNFGQIVYDPNDQNFLFNEEQEMDDKWLFKNWDKY